MFSRERGKTENTSRKYTINSVLLQAKVGQYIYILSRASEVRSPINHLGSGQRRDTDLDKVNLMTDYLRIVFSHKN